MMTKRHKVLNFDASMMQLQCINDDYIGNIELALMQHNVNTLQKSMFDAR